MMLLSDLVTDVVICKRNLANANADLTSAQNTFLNALAMNGTPLVVGRSIVIGDKLFNRPYTYGQLEVVDIANVPASTVVQS